MYEGKPPRRRFPHKHSGVMKKKSSPLHSESPKAKKQVKLCQRISNRMSISNSFSNSISLDIFLNVKLIVEELLQVFVCGNFLCLRAL